MFNLKNLLIFGAGCAVGYAKGVKDADTMKHVIDELNKTEDGRQIIADFRDLVKRAKDLKEDVTKPEPKPEPIIVEPTPPDSSIQ